jgi:hypothetical protein
MVYSFFTAVIPQIGLAVGSGYSHLNRVFLAVVKKGNRRVGSLDAVNSHAHLAIPGAPLPDGEGDSVLANFWVQPFPRKRALQWSRISVGHRTGQSSNDSSMFLSLPFYHCPAEHFGPTCSPFQGGFISIPLPNAIWESAGELLPQSDDPSSCQPFQ